MPNANVLASATSYGGTAIEYVPEAQMRAAWRFEPGYHPEQGAPISYIALPPQLDAQHPVSFLEYATLDGLTVVVGGMAAGRVVSGAVGAFYENDTKLHEALERIEQPPIDHQD